MFDPNLSTHFPNQSNPNYPYLSFPQPLPPSASTPEQYIHPPGTDPYANSGPYPFTHVGFQAQPSFGEDPNAVSQNWVVKQAASVRYDAVSVFFFF